MARHRITSRHAANMSGRWVLGIFGAIFACIGAIALLIGLTDSSADQDVWAPLIVGGVFIAFGVLVVLGSIFGKVYRTGGTPQFDGSQRWGEGHWPWFPPANTKNDTVPSGEVVLAPKQTRLFSALFPILFGFVWTGVSGAFWWIEFSRGGFKHFPVIFLSLFLLVGLVVFAAGFFGLLRLVLVGPTKVIVSKECVEPGETISFRVKQRGIPRVNKASIVLECHEEATYRRGSNTHTKTNMLSQQVIAEIGESSVPSDHVLLRGEFQIPSDAMHSFMAQNNAVNWTLVLVLDIPMRPDVKETYPIRVEPKRR